MANEKKSQMRASTARERLYDYMNQFLQGVAEQPAARIAEPILGMKGLADSQKMPLTPPSPEEMATGMFMGSVRPTTPRASSIGMNSTKIAPTHPSLPPEFNKTMSSRTGPIDMNELPSGNMQYLDSDVADYMNPAKPDPTTPEGQRRLRVLMDMVSGRNR
jgi:hypothetical protein